ncbi:MAG: helix-turn-helix transcriptional regulator [Oscillospiraceae bacterium]|nr:helix-turn-helix transcriptional regulator [Oscillospiraceae bacterium]
MDIQQLQISFAARLSELRREQGLSQEQLAERVNVSRQAVSKWESAQCLPETEKLALLCAALGCSADLLLFGSAPKQAEKPSAAQRAAQPLGLALCYMGAVLFLALLWVRQDARCWIFGCAFQLAGLAAYYALRGSAKEDKQMLRRGSFALAMMPAAGLSLAFAVPLMRYVLQDYSAVLQVAALTLTPILCYAAAVLAILLLAKKMK